MLEWSELIGAIVLLLRRYPDAVGPGQLSIVSQGKIRISPAVGRRDRIDECVVSTRFKN